jgi:hypothetical protein
MSQILTRKLGLREKRSLRVSGVIALWVLVVLGLLGARQSLAQSQTENTTASALPYEVATVKPNKSGAGMYMMGWVSPDRYITGGTLDSLIKQAYEIQDDQVMGAPKWISSETYDVQAKIDPSLGGALGFDQRMIQSRLILQSLLADRFKLTLHHETKELPICAGNREERSEPSDRWRHLPERDKRHV